MRVRRLLFWLTFGLLVALGVALSPRPLDLPPITAAPPQPVDAWVAAQVSAAQGWGARPGSEPRLARAVEGKSTVAFLYLHGFGASRGEGEAVLEPIAAERGANALYLLLPGHGTDDPDVHARPRAEDYLAAAEQGLVEAEQLGDKVVLFGTSTGGLLATWLAARHPDAVAAMVLGSPFYAFRDPKSFLLDTRIGPLLIPMAFGRDRYAGWTEDPEQRVQPGYDEHWTTHQRVSALFNLADLRRSVATPDVFQAVKAPTLLLYYERDAEHQDTVVSVDAMKQAFALFGGGDHPKSRMAAIEDGNHILFSAFVRTDKEKILHEIRSFLDEAL